VSTTIVLNNKILSEFPIYRGVRQRCPLAPYLFLLVEEALNMVVEEELPIGKIKGIELLNSIEQ